MNESGTWGSRAASGSPHSAGACIQALKASLCQAEWEGGGRGCELLPVTQAWLLSISLTHTHTHTHMHTEPLMAGTYRDEDGLIEQLRRRVKHIEEESLLVQGKRGTDEGPLSPGPEGTATAHPPGLVHTARIQRAQPSTMLWGFNLTEVVIARTGRPAPWTVRVWSRGSPLSSSSDNLLRTGHCSPPNARAIGKT